MNFKKTLGLVLTAVLVSSSSSLLAVKPVKAATTAPVVATAPSTALTGFNYFYAERSLLVAGEQDSYVVDTNYSGKVQYEFWVKKADDANAKWQVISVDANGNPGYTAPVDGHNSPYAIPILSSFKFQQGKYYTAVYAKLANTTGTKTYGHFVDQNGVDTDSKSGTEQKYDIVNTGYFNAVSTDYKAKYNEMLGDFLFSSNSSSKVVKGQKATFSGFAGQKNGARYKLVVRKFGTDASAQTVINSDKFQTSVDWTPTEAGTYQVIAWSEPINSKDGVRDGWRIGTITVGDASTTTLSVTGVADYNPFMGYQDVSVNDSSLVSKVIINGTETKFSAPSATKVRIVCDEPTSIVLVDAQGNQVTALAGSTTPTKPAASLSVASVPDYNPFMGYQDISVNDSSLVSKVIINGTETKFSKPSATKVRVVCDEPTSIVLVDAQGNQVTAK